MTIRWQYRIAAALALICMLGAIASLIAAVVVDVARIWVVLVGFVGCGLGLWYFLSRHGLVRILGALVGIASFVGIGFGLWWAQNARWLVFMAFADLGLLWLLLRFPLIWLHNDPGVPRRRVESGALIINPASGDGVAEEVELEDAARSMGLRVTVLDEGDDIVALAQECIDAGADALGMAGGDGSLARVAEIASEANIPFVCIPAGTRNHFAQDLGLDRNRVVDALQAFGPAMELRVDMGRVNDTAFLNNVSVGLYGEVIDDDDYRESKIATALSKLPELLGPDADQLGITYTDRDGNEQNDAVVLHISNNAHNLSPLPGFGQRMSLQRGELGIVAMRQVNSGSMPRMFSWVEQTLTVQGNSALAVGRDGEAEEYETPITFHIDPAALKVRVPIGMYFHSGSVQINATTPKKLWGVLRGTPFDSVL